MPEPENKPHVAVVLIVVALCVAVCGFMFFVPSDSLAVDLVYRTF